MSILDNLSTETILDVLDEAGQVPVRSNGPTFKDTGVPRGKGDKPTRNNYLNAVSGHDRVIPDDGDLKDFLPADAAREITPAVKKSKYMLEDFDDNYEYDEDYYAEDYDEEYDDEPYFAEDYDESDLELEEAFDALDEAFEEDYSDEDKAFLEAVDNTIDDVLFEASIMLEGKGCSGKDCCEMDEYGGKDCKKGKKPVEPDEIDADSDTLDEDFDIDEEYDAFMEEEKEEELKEMQLIDEELEDIESFLEEC